jgi:hypothetical protein
MRLSYQLAIRKIFVKWKKNGNGKIGNIDKLENG